MRKINKKGFTLIELLVVIAIIGLLSTLAVVSLNNARQKARDARRVSDIKQIQTAFELYYNDCSGYPATADTTAGASIAGSDGNCSSPNSITYMAIIPSNPSPEDATATGCGGSGYTYTQTDSGSSYTLQYCLGAAINNITGDTLHYATPAGIANP